MTVRDVAARAGVSPATVSRVFTQPEAVAPETRQRVLAAAEELRYAPNPGRPLARPPPHRQPRHRRARHRQLVLRRGHQGGPAGGAAGGVRAVRRGVGRARRRRGAVGPGTGPAGGRVAAGLAAVAGRGPPRAWPTPFRSWSPTGCSTASLPSSPSPRPPRAMPWSTCTRWATATLAYLAGPDGYSNTRRVAGLHAACARLGLDPVVLGPFPARFSSGVRAADLVLAAGATAVDRLQRRHRRRAARPASPTAGCGFPTTSASSATTTPRSPRWSPRGSPPSTSRPPRPEPPPPNC